MTYGMTLPGMTGNGPSGRKCRRNAMMMPLASYVSLAVKALRVLDLAGMVGLPAGHGIRVAS